MSLSILITTTDDENLTLGKSTKNDWNNLSHDCVNASSVNRFNNQTDNYLAGAWYTKVENLNVLEIILILIKLFIHIFILIYLLLYQIVLL